MDNIQDLPKAVCILFGLHLDYPTSMELRFPVHPTGCGSQTVHQPAENVYAMKGDSVTLECSYENSGGNDYIFWYKQDGQAAPKFILSLSIRSQGKTESSFEKRFSCSINDTAKRAPLKIQDVQLSDSAVFYCAIQPTMTDIAAAPTQKPL